MTTSAEVFAKVLGRTVRLYREVRGVSLSEMATELGFASVSGWSRVETGDTVMTVVQLYAAAKFLKVEPHDVVKSAMGMMLDRAEPMLAAKPSKLGFSRCSKPASNGHLCKWNLLEGDCPDHATPIPENLR